MDSPRNWWCSTGHGWNKLEFRDTSEECVICYEMKGEEMKLPQCTHWLCIDCCRKFLLWDEVRYHVDPVPYGCPPCEHYSETTLSCKSRSCSEEDDKIVDQWKLLNPSQYSKWNDDENYSIEHSDDPNYGNKKCPLCRAEYKKIIICIDYMYVSI